jgi:uncharacterized membrane protein
VLGFGPLHCPYNVYWTVMGVSSVGGKRLINTGVSVANLVLSCRVTFNLVKLGQI